MGDAGVPGVGDNCFTHRDMDSVQESSRCKQTKPSLWPTRPAGRIRDHQARSRVRGCSARGLHGMPHVLSGLAPRPRKPEGRTRNREAGDRPEGITPTGGSAPNEAHTPNRHTHGKDTPGTPTDPSRQYADCSQQSAVSSQQSQQLQSRSTQYRKEVTPHMHTPATTHPQDRHTQWKTAPGPTLGEPTRPAHPTPASPAEPAPAPVRLDPGRRTARPAAPTAPQPPPLPLPLSLPLWARRRASSDSSGPGRDTPTPATPASVAASPNPDRHDARPGNTTAKARHRSVAAACSPTQTSLAPGREPLANCSLAVADRLQPPARPQAATPSDHPPLRRCRL